MRINEFTYKSVLAAGSTLYKIPKKKAYAGAIVANLMAITMCLVAIVVWWTKN